MKNTKTLATCQYSNDYEVVLCEWECGSRSQYVTWEHKIGSKDFYFWGHYFDSELHAKIDFHQRALDNLKEQVPPFEV